MLLTPIAAHRDTVVRVWKLDPQRSIDRFPLSYPELGLWRERMRGLQRIAAISYADTHTAALFLGDESMPVTIAPVSADFRNFFGGAQNESSERTQLDFGIRRQRIRRLRERNGRKDQQQRSTYQATCSHDGTPL